MNKKVASGLFWKLLENGGSQAVQFVVSVILARLLSPREYTVIAIIMIFTTIVQCARAKWICNRPYSEEGCRWG